MKVGVGAVVGSKLKGGSRLRVGLGDVLGGCATTMLVGVAVPTATVGDPPNIPDRITRTATAREPTTTNASQSRRGSLPGRAK